MNAPGLFSDRSLLVLDVVILAAIAAVPLLYIAWRYARSGRWATHRNVMLVTTAVLGVAVVAVELALNAAGGVFVMAEGSTYDGTTLLAASLWIHVAFASLTSLWWPALIALSLWRFSRPPKPGSFSRIHKIGGYGGLILMALTGLTAAELYVVAFLL